MMLHLGFSDSFVSIIMSCIKSISYAVLFNGEPVEHIKPTRGLCQGNPLSPYMFLLCAIGLQGLLRKVESDGAIRGYIFVVMGHVSLTFSLQMIVFSSVVQSKLNAKSF